MSGITTSKLQICRLYLRSASLYANSLETTVDYSVTTRGRRMNSSSQRLTSATVAEPPPLRLLERPPRPPALPLPAAPAWLAWRLRVERWAARMLATH
jgi:hypothetical protein